MGQKVALLFHCQGWGGPANLHMDQFSVQTIKYGRNMTNVDFDSGRMLKTIAWKVGRVPYMISETSTEDRRYL